MWMGDLKQSDVHWVVNDYIGVTDGYLGDFSYRSHREFYPAYCDLEINPDEITGTTRERFLHILRSSDSRTQVAILRGVATKYPVGSAIYRTKAASDRLAKLMAQCSDAAAVAVADLSIKSQVVEQALADAATLLATNGPTSAVDRIHTALHGYLKAACATENIAVPSDAIMTAVFKLLKQQHSRLRALGTHQEAVVRVLQSLASIMDAMNPVRNRGSLAHPNEDLLDKHEAILFINAARTILQYLDAMVASPSKS
jgi:hypothetical protein